MSKKYYIVTFGCQANEADGERIRGWYQSRGWQEAKTRLESNELVFNTCSVRESAENRVLGQINNIFKHKQKTKSKKPLIILTGCMTRLGKRRLMSIPGIDKVWPIDKFSFNLPSIPQKKDQALVPIMTGCDNYCTYCVVPYARGREQSRTLDEIVCEVEALLDRGFDTIMLLGQNVNSYHKNKKLKSRDQKLNAIVNKLHKKYHNNFAVLLALLNDFKGLKNIKFMSSNPHDFDDGIIQALKLPKIDNYLHLALQSGDDEILKKMNRKHTAGDFQNLVRKIRKARPGIAIGTDIIVGFPGETLKQWQNTFNLCKKINFSRAFISKYSPRVQTAAYKLKDDIPFVEKKRRWQILSQLINEKKK